MITALRRSTSTHAGTYSQHDGRLTSLSVAYPNSDSYYSINGDVLEVIGSLRTPIGMPIDLRYSLGVT